MRRTSAGLLATALAVLAVGADASAAAHAADPALPRVCAYGQVPNGSGVKVAVSAGQAIEVDIGSSSTGSGFQATVEVDNSPASGSKWVPPLGGIATWRFGKFSSATPVYYEVFISTPFGTETAGGAYRIRSSTCGETMYLAQGNVDGTASSAFPFGGIGDKPVTGDWDGDGATEIGVLQGSQWWLADRWGVSRSPFSFGLPGDIPVAGDWNADGIDTIGVYRPSNGTWYLRNSNSPGEPDTVFRYGLPTGVPVAGDWNGDGFDTPGVYRGEGLWVLSDTQGGTDRITFNYGVSTDRPVAGDWNGDGKDTPGILRGSGEWVLSNSLGGSDRIRFVFGAVGDVPLAGDWNGDGPETVGVARGY